jgi:hypothetical protein
VRSSASSQRAKRRPRKGSCMKKTNNKPGRMITRTIEQIENRRMTKAERDRLKRLAALPDDQIDTSDIPEVKNRAGWVRVHEHPEHPLHRVLSRLLSIRLPEPDIALARRSSANPMACCTKPTSSRCCMKRSNASGCWPSGRLSGACPLTGSLPAVGPGRRSRGRASHREPW